MDEIKLPTLDELEAWWLAHPSESARTKQPDECLIAVPMTEMNGADVEVEPSPRWYPIQMPYIRVHKGVHTLYSPLPTIIELPAVLNDLARDFDELTGRPEDIEDEEDDRQYIRSEDCVTFIRQFKAKRGA